MMNFKFAFFIAFAQLWDACESAHSVGDPGSLREETHLERIKWGESGRELRLLFFVLVWIFWFVCAQFVGDKVAYALTQGLKVIACVGETLEQRESGSTMSVVSEQTRSISGNAIPCTLTHLFVALFVYFLAFNSSNLYVFFFSPQIKYRFGTMLSLLTSQFGPLELGKLPPLPRLRK